MFGFVLAFPAPELAPGLRDALELLAIQALVTQASVEALADAVLPCLLHGSRNTIDAFNGYTRCNQGLRA